MKNSQVLFAGIALASFIFIGSSSGLFLSRSYAHQDKDIPATDSHGHGKLEIPQGEPAPTVSLTVHPDSIKGYNLQIETTNFKFAPENIGKTSSFREGHAHLYVDGKKITRIYSNWFYLSDIATGNREITVTLNSNEHEDLMVNDKRVEATATISVPDKTRE